MSLGVMSDAADDIATGADVSPPNNNYTIINYVIIMTWMAVINVAGRSTILKREWSGVSNCIPLEYFCEATIIKVYI